MRYDVLGRVRLWCVTDGASMLLGRHFVRDGWRLHATWAPLCAVRMALPCYLGATLCCTDGACMLHERYICAVRMALACYMSATFVLYGWRLHAT